MSATTSGCPSTVIEANVEPVSLVVVVPPDRDACATDRMPVAWTSPSIRLTFCTVDVVSLSAVVAVVEPAAVSVTVPLSSTPGTLTPAPLRSRTTPLVPAHGSETLKLGEELSSGPTFAAVP